MSYVQQPLKHREAPRLLTGHGSFVDDIQLPDMLYACALRSPSEAARRLPGAGAVFTGANIAGARGDLPTRAVIEVDRATGEVNIVRYVAVHDCGHIINPLLVQGQGTRRYRSRH